MGITTRKRKHRRSEDHPDGPLVEIDAGRLREAIEERGCSVSALARKVRTRQQTLDYLVQGHVQKCRFKIRGRLAKTLKVRVTWLAGHTRLPHTWDRPEMDKDGNILISLWPPLSRLAASELITRCLKAWERDLSAGRGRVPTTLPNLKAVHRLGRFARADFVGQGLFILLDPMRWRNTISGKRVHMEGEERSSGTVALVGFADSVLASWIEGETPLDYTTVYPFIDDVLRETPFLNLLTRTKLSRAAKSNEETLTTT